LADRVTAEGFGGLPWSSQTHADSWSTSIRCWSVFRVRLTSYVAATLTASRADIVVADVRATVDVTCPSFELAWSTAATQWQRSIGPSAGRHYRRTQSVGGRNRGVDTQVPL